jgi:predicted dithiol-disulfide oxidoreductase (DUF899 family)
MPNHQVVSRDAWIDARRAFLAKEKEVSRLNDELSRRRRELPWVKVDKNYTFDTPARKKTLADLFAGRSQLIVYHFMFGPGWSQGCPGCSYLMDHIDGAIPHLNARGVTFVAASRAPLAQIQAFQKRMGWRFPWVSSGASDFNYDYHVSFTKAQLAMGSVDYNYREKENSTMEDMPGLSVFFKDENGDIFHTYSTYDRGLDPLVGTYRYIDLTPMGRHEEDLPFPMSWVRHHDRYQDPKAEFAKPWEEAAHCPHCAAEAAS